MSSWITNPDGFLAKQFHPVPKLEKKSQKAAKKKHFSGFQKQKPLKKSQFKRKNKQLTAEEKRIRAAVIKRDEGNCIICGQETNAPPHHIIPKGQGGRGVLASAIDSLFLRAVVCESCHYPIHHQEGGWNPYTFYLHAQQTGYTERIILMELLIDEWAKWICIDTDLADQIRQRNQERWKKVFKHDIPITPYIIGTHWEEMLNQEVAA